jgi:fructose-1,6-bisphosphatase/inositol monophosphatase family enzyme
MGKDNQNLIDICKNALMASHNAIKSVGKAGKREITTDTASDITTSGDIKVSETLINFFKELDIPVVIYSEESGIIEIQKKPQFVITLDDIDGTHNYFRGEGMLPHCTIVTIFDSFHPCFKDALVAGIIEHNSANLWHAVREEGCYLNDKRTRTSGKQTIDKKTAIIIDHYASSDQIKKLLKLYKEGWIKDFGSAGFHLAGISSGLFDAYISFAQKAHELGAGYLAVKEAGGCTLKLDGSHLDDDDYVFEKTYDIIAASSESLAKKIIETIVTMD